MDDLVQKLPLCHLGLVELRIAAHVLDRDGDLEEVLYLPNPLCGGMHCFEGIRQRKQIVGVASVYASPAQVVREPGSSGPPGELLETLKVFAIGRLRRTKIHGNAVLNDPILFANLVEDLERAAAIDHIVFRNDLKPIDNRLFGEDVIVMWDPQPDTDTVIGKGIKSVGWHQKLLLLKKRELE